MKHSNDFVNNTRRIRFKDNRNSKNIFDSKLLKHLTRNTFLLTVITSAKSSTLQVLLQSQQISDNFRKCYGDNYFSEIDKIFSSRT